MPRPQSRAQCDGFTVAANTNSEWGSFDQASAQCSVPSAHVAVKDASRRSAVPLGVGILDRRFAAASWLLGPKADVCLLEACHCVVQDRLCPIACAPEPTSASFTTAARPDSRTLTPH